MPKKDLKKARKDWDDSLKGAEERREDFITTSSVPIDRLYTPEGIPNTYL